MGRTATLVLISFTVLGAFVWWFAPLGLRECTDVNGAMQCYGTEDAFEATLASLVSAGGGIAAAMSAVVLIGRWLIAKRSGAHQLG